ncbi:MAG: carbohydrate-binding domain-containing protein [Clostridia bacterium]|nr:carbohydrate-binding domain-containing protein [Clostridia bacterium]
MKKVLALILAWAVLLALASCGTAGTNRETTRTGADTSSETQAVSETETTVVEEAVTDADISAQESTDAFSISSEDGVFSRTDSLITIESAGTYTLSGLLEGQILVEAGEEDDVVIELNGVTLICGTDSPIKALSASSLDISAKKGTENVIRDTRTVKKTDDETQGEGAIYAKCDLKIKGSGTLVVEAAYNNGIHTTKDLTVQNLSLKVTACNNALKGNDSVTVKSGSVVAISTQGDGIKTQNTDANKTGETRGDIAILGGSVTVYAAGDGIQAAHDFEMTTGEDAQAAPTLTVYTGSYSGYTASGASTTSYKGIKVQNELNVRSGSVVLKTYDDGLHADYGTSFTDGTKGAGTIHILGGTTSISVYSPANKTAGGRQGPGGWGGQQQVSGADAIHADSVLNISGGTITIDSSYEGLEANTINISGGVTYVAGNDDGVNACSGIATPSVNVTGGYLDVTVSPSGDTDGIDSNGSYTQTGGIVITRGPSSEMAAAIDADRTVSVSGGTLVVLGYGRVSTSGSVKSSSLNLHSSGSHTVNIGGTTYTFTNAYSYGRTYVYSDTTVSA